MICFDTTQLWILNNVQIRVKLEYAYSEEVGACEEIQRII